MWFNHINRSIDIVRQCWRSAAYSSYTRPRVNSSYRYCLPTDLPGSVDEPESAVTSARVDRNTELTFTLVRKEYLNSLYNSLYNRQYDYFYKPRYSSFYSGCSVSISEVGKRLRQSAVLCRQPEKRILHRTLLMAVSKISRRAPRILMATCVHWSPKTRITGSDRVLYERSKDNGPFLPCTSLEWNQIRVWNSSSRSPAWLQNSLIRA